MTLINLIVILKNKKISVDVVIFSLYFIYFLLEFAIYNFLYFKITIEFIDLM
jgi:hypothetical protein